MMGGPIETVGVVKYSCHLHATIRLYTSKREVIYFQKMSGYGS